MSNLKELREAMERAEQRYRYLGMMNTVGQTPEQAIEQDIEYQAAIQAYADASQRYRSAIDQAALYRGLGQR